MDGLMMVIVGLTIPYLILDRLSVWVLVWPMVFASYGFVVAFTISAWKGYRGLAAKPYGLNTILHSAHIIGAPGSLVGITIVIYGSFRAF